MHSDEIVDVADLDVIYLSYDEPQKEEFWIKIKNMVPWAKRVDGVKGSDAAHKAAAEASDTERFILIDGDNMPNEDFFNLQLDFTDKAPTYKLAQYRWRAINHINGLRYGNGGMSSWTKTYVMNILPKDEFIPYMYESLKFMEDNLDDDRADAFSTIEYEKFKRVVDYMAETMYSGQKLIEGRRDFYNWFNEIDDRRETDLLTVYPEMLDFYRLCQEVNLMNPL
jgi:hypothetical protein